MTAEREALIGLAANAGALRAFEPEVRAAIGNTNWQAIMDYVAMADAALSQPVEQPSAEPVALTDEELARIAYKGFDDYWTEDSAGKEGEAWAASAKAVLAAASPQPPATTGADALGSPTIPSAANIAAGFAAIARGEPFPINDAFEAWARDEWGATASWPDNAWLGFHNGYRLGLARGVGASPPEPQATGERQPANQEAPE